MGSHSLGAQERRAALLNTGGAVRRIARRAIPASNPRTCAAVGRATPVLSCSHFCLGCQVQPPCFAWGARTQPISERWWGESGENELTNRRLRGACLPRLRGRARRAPGKRRVERSRVGTGLANGLQGPATVRREVRVRARAWRAVSIRAAEWARPGRVSRGRQGRAGRAGTAMPLAAPDARER